MLHDGKNDCTVPASLTPHKTRNVMLCHVIPKSTERHVAIWPLTYSNISWCNVTLALSATCLHSSHLIACKKRKHTLSTLPSPPPPLPLSLHSSLYTHQSYTHITPFSLSTTNLPPRPLFFLTPPLHPPSFLFMTLLTPDDTKLELCTRPLSHALFSLINAHRVSHALLPLEWDRALYYLAYEHCKHMYTASSLSDLQTCIGTPLIANLARLRADQPSECDTTLAKSIFTNWLRTDNHWLKDRFIFAVVACFWGEGVLYACNIVAHGPPVPREVCPRKRCGGLVHYNAHVASLVFGRCVGIDIEAPLGRGVRTSSDVG